MTRRIGGIAVALAMACAGTATAATPFNLGPGFSPDVKVDAGGKAHVGWIEQREETADSPSQVHYCRIDVTAQTCEAKALGGPNGIGVYPYSVGRPLELFLNPVDGKVRLFTTCYNCDHGGAQTSEHVVATDGTSMARRTSGADPEGGGMVGNVRTNGKSAYDAAAGVLYGTDSYDFQAMPLAPDPSDAEPARLSPFPGGSGFDGATGLANGPSGPVQVAVYIGKLSGGATTELRFLTHAGSDGVNTAANWQGGTASIGSAQHIATESGGSGVTLLTTRDFSSTLGGIVEFRRFDAASRTFGDPVTLASPSTGDKNPNEPDLFEAANGRLYAVWYDTGRIRFATSADGATWTFPETVVNDSVVSTLRVAGTGAPDQGLVVWNTNAHDDGVVKAAPLSPLEPMACPGDPRCPAPPQQPEPRKPPVAPARGVVKKGTLSQLRWSVRAPLACVPAGIKVHVSIGVGKRKLTKKQAKILKGKHVKVRRLALYYGAKRIAITKRSPMNGLHDSTGMKAGSILRYQVRIVYTRKGKKKAFTRKISVPVTIC